MNPEDEPSEAPKTKDEIFASVRAMRDNAPFEPFEIVTVAGRSYPIPTPDHLDVPAFGRTVVVLGDLGIVALLHASQISDLVRINPRKRKKTA